MEGIQNINVGVLGHVDSGKTSLVKALSTHLSTAALDKSQQSRQRGMTLDLGFSCFFLDERQQITLVDCPGHASLIRTIIGGAQIIDVVLLVVDAYKGWQAQTTECLVLAELTSPFLIVALNKIDMLEDRQQDILKARRDVRERLRHTRFADAPMIGVAAAIGGEKIAANLDSHNETVGMEELVRVLRESVPKPKRTMTTGPFYFSVDHCFPIRGRGTVMTGTVLSGSIRVNDLLEFPALGQERKVKSMQMFKRQVDRIQQGDRAGICISNLDSKLVERGIAATPQAVPLLQGAVALVRKVKYYPGSLPCGAKFHISVGHTTIMATATFFGAQELLEYSTQQLSSEEYATDDSKELIGSSSLGGKPDMAGLPRIPFDINGDFLHQDKLLESLDGHTDLLQWAFLNFQTPVHCPMESLVIGSRLDTVDNASGAASSCRLAFSGRLMKKVHPEYDAPRIRIYTPKERRGIVARLGEPFRRNDDDKVVRYEVFGDDLFKKETNMKLFIGMKVETIRGEVGEIKSSYGTSGMFRVFFPGGTEALQGEPLLLRFKRFAHDPTKSMHQDQVVPLARVGTRMEEAPRLPDGVSRRGEVASVKGDVYANGKHSVAVVSGFFTPAINIKEFAGTKVKVGEDVGSIVGAFGKAGKCKVSFPTGISPDTVGSKAELL